MRRRSRNDVPLARLFGVAHPARGASRQARPLADRPEPPLAPGRDADQRRRLRRRLVRTGGGAEGLPQHASGVERPQPARARRRDLLTALLRPYPRLHGHGDPGDEHASVPLREPALDAQRAHPRLPSRQARAAERRRRRVLRLHRRDDRLRDDVLSRAHVRARGRSGRGSRADGRLRGGDRSCDTASSIRSR